MNYINHLNTFLIQIKTDDRITPIHIALYMALFHHWNQNRFQNPFTIFRDDIMQQSHIGSKNTYHKSLKDLHQYKYIIIHITNSKYKPVLITIIHLCPKTDTHTSTDFDTRTCTESGTLPCPKSDTHCVSKSVHTCVPKVVHLIKQTINNKTYSQIAHEKIFKKNQPLIEQTNNLARVPKLVHTKDPPTITEVEQFFHQQNQPNIEAQKFHTHYEAIAWTISSTPVQNWQALANKWIINKKTYKNKQNEKHQRTDPHPDTNYNQPL